MRRASGASSSARSPRAFAPGSKGEVVHIDASLIRADVSWEAPATRWVDKVGQENAPIDEQERDAKQTGKYKKVCTTDPDATMSTSGRNQRLEPSYKQHTSVCDVAGVIVDIAVTTGETNEGSELVPAIELIEILTGAHVVIATADAGTPTQRSMARSSGV